MIFCCVGVSSVHTVVASQSDTVGRVEMPKVETRTDGDTLYCKELLLELTSITRLSQYVSIVPYPALGVNSGKSFVDGASHSLTAIGQ